VFVFDLQTGLATAMVEAQILEVFPHVHVNVVMMRGGEGVGGTKPLKRQSNTIVVSWRDVLVECWCWCNGRNRQLHRQISRKPTKNQKTAAQQM